MWGDRKENVEAEFFYNSKDSILLMNSKRYLLRALTEWSLTDLNPININNETKSGRIKKG